MMDADKAFLLNIARGAIKSRFEGLDFFSSDVLKDVPKSLKVDGCCFVTLTLAGELRGCIGHLEAFEPLYKNVINNSINAAFNDSRFMPLSFNELDNIKIEISILSHPEHLVYLNGDDLLFKLSYDMGVILRKGSFSATFLPQVWELFPNKVDFLEALCEKAGLHSGAWRDNPEILVYSVDKFSE